MTILLNICLSYGIAQHMSDPHLDKVNYMAEFYTEFYL